jgi:hypothetical protein
MQYSYNWYIQQFEESKEQANQFLHSIDNEYFLQRPNQKQWCIAECYDHLIQFGNIYLDNLSEKLSTAQQAEDPPLTFPPRWLWKKVADFFEPPYSIKLNTISSMQPEVVEEDFNKSKLLNSYTDLQDRFIHQLKHSKDNAIHLNKARIPHPIVYFLKLTGSEYYLLAAAISDETHCRPYKRL